MIHSFLVYTFRILVNTELVMMKDIQPVVIDLLQIITIIKWLSSHFFDYPLER